MKRSALSELGRNTQPPAISWLMEVALSRPNLVSLAAGFTDNESLPLQDTRQIVEEILCSPKTGRPALQYGTTAGDPDLRKLSAEMTYQADVAAGGQSAKYSASQTVITHGSQQLLYILTEALCDPGDIVIVEDPTYFVYLGIAQSHRLQTRGVRLQCDGLDIAHLEEILESLKKAGQLPQLKMLYLVSYFQNPTSTTTSYAKKVQALELLRRYEKFAGHPIYLLEDAAYRELRFSGPDQLSALAARKFADRVLYTSTYSKPFASGVRVGFGILPPEILEVVLRIKGNHDFGTANLLQRIMTAAVTSTAYKKHLPNLRSRYAQKALTMTKAIREHFPEQVAWAEPTGGLYVWAKVPDRIKSGTKSKLFQLALENDVLFVPGELCYAEDPTRRKPNSAMRISFGGATEKNISLGIERLGSVLKKVIG
jgi:2-aminoadipate transaminase